MGKIGKDIPYKSFQIALRSPAIKGFDALLLSLRAVSRTYLDCVKENYRLRLNIGDFTMGIHPG